MLRQFAPNREIKIEYNGQISQSDLLQLSGIINLYGGEKAGSLVIQYNPQCISHEAIVNYIYGRGLSIVSLDVRDADIDAVVGAMYDFNDRRGSND